jgi:type IV fimbrial biogenesis protein FimT
VTREQSDATETIVRGVLRHRAGALSLEGGIEGALNTLDSHSALEEDGINVPLPAGDMRVQITSPTADCQADGGPIACLRVELSPLGQVRMCNPNFAAPDPQACTP